jgi:hydrogenase-4 membrane subunit HyfE
MQKEKKKKRGKKQGEQPEELTLIPEKEIAGHTVKPWTLATMVKLAPVFMRTRKRALQEKIAIDIENDMTGFAMFLLPDVPEIVAITLGIPPKEAEDLVGGDAVVIVLTILQQNVSYLKNLVGPLVAAIHAITGP